MYSRYFNPADQTVDTYTSSYQDNIKHGSYLLHTSEFISLLAKPKVTNCTKPNQHRNTDLNFTQIPTYVYYVQSDFLQSIS